MNIITAQLTMIPMALLVAYYALNTKGINLFYYLLSSLYLLRGVLVASIISPWVLLSVQMLYGIGASLLCVAILRLIARILNGSGSFNSDLAAVMTMQGMGGSFSASVGGIVACYYSYSYAIMALAGIAKLAFFFMAAGWFRGT